MSKCGEAQAICLAEKLNAGKLLMDDRDGRELARERKLKVSGLLGELVHAKLMGRIQSVPLESKLFKRTLDSLFAKILGT